MTSSPEISAPSLDHYVSTAGAAEVEELRTLAGSLEGSVVEMVNSTAVGGGVAEILTRLLPLMRELGLDARWHVMEGGPEFYDVTKAFHNALHGSIHEFRPRDFDIFLDYNRLNRQHLPLDGRFIVIHDPQPPAFSRQLPIPQYLFYPSIDPLSEKNRDLTPEFIADVLTKFGIDPNRTVLTQISRFDRLKDPLGVLRAYRIVKRYFDCQLVLAGGGASDDPEGNTVLAEVREAAGSDPDVFILELPPSDPLVVNALQRPSTIIIQKSLREGFGLTVAEALWKKKPVVASAAGGIPTQVIHRHTGLLAHSVEGTAYQIRFLLAHPDIAQRLGEQGHEHVRENFLITGNLKRYLTLFLHSQFG